MTEFHLLRPWALFGLIPLLLLLWKLKQHKLKLHAWLAVCDPHLLKHLIQDTGVRVKSHVTTLLGCIGVLSILALTGPTWSRLPQPVLKQQQARVIVLDLSNAMLGKDIKPSRLIRAKFIIRDLLKNSGNGQWAMVAFTQEGFVVSPLTDDGRTIVALVDELSPQMMPVAGSNISQGLDKAQELIKQAGFSRGKLILLTANAANANDISTASGLATRGITTDVIAMATKPGAPVAPEDEFVQTRFNKVISRLDDASLRQLARAGEGLFFEGAQLNRIKRLLRPAGDIQYTLNKDKQVNTWDDRGRELLWLILPLFLVLFRKAWLENVS